MKKLIIIFLGLILLISCSENIERKPKYCDFDNAWERDNLFGQVKELVQYKENVIDFESGKTENSIVDFKKEYTNFGEISYQEHFDNFGKSEQYIKNEYNDKEQRIKSISVDNVMSSKSIEIAEFDSKGKQVLAYMNFNDTLDFLSKFEYDSLGNLTKLINIINNDTTIGRFEYIHNDSGKILMKKQIDYDEYGSHENINEFKYDKNGNLIELVYKSEHVGEIKSTYEYNNKNRIKRITHYQSGQIERETSFDKYYNPVSIKFYVGATLNRELKYKYEFDSHRNWIERKAFMKEYLGKDKKFLPIFIETRKIEYYE